MMLEMSSAPSSPRLLVSNMSFCSVWLWLSASQSWDNPLMPIAFLLKSKLRHLHSQQGSIMLHAACYNGNSGI